MILNIDKKIQAIFENSFNLYPFLKEMANEINNPHPEVIENLEVTGHLKAHKFSVFADDESRMIDANNVNKTTSLYGSVRIGSAETPTNLDVNGDATFENVFVTDEFEFEDETADFGTNAKAKINAAIEPMFDEVATDDIVSKTLVSEEAVEFASFNSTDNHWHLSNTKVDDTLQIDGELEIGSMGDFGSNAQATIKEIAGVPDGTGHLGQVLMHITTGNEWADYTPASVHYKNVQGSNIGSLKFVKCTQAEYSAITTKDNNTLYIVTDN